jgi:hypothetical protein
MLKCVFIRVELLIFESDGSTSSIDIIPKLQRIA